MCQLRFVIAIALILFAHGGLPNADSQEILVRFGQPQPFDAPLPTPPAKDDEGDAGFLVQTKPPSLTELFRLQTERAFLNRTASELKIEPQELNGAFETSATRGPHVPRQMSGNNVVVEPNRAKFGRLYFEQRNAERYGQDFGPFHAAICSSRFFVDLALWPMRIVCSSATCESNDEDANCVVSSMRSRSSFSICPWFVRCSGR